ncbi:NAD-dependent deacetylase [Gillisia sp. Hel_I_86]|uniref:SIR2 family NAD-dependent protein deacylase n=1 Tax=Gillisia sp. Hel_I_86 TaxID=1249981 RepID=UPI00119A2851|nr:NAD-dependent deacylase [Gillisia sp. Hel_I_86]TVZ28555.1 NAD-dependent deacetylase [Gillisia sp. Hel_I_86]
MQHIVILTGAGISAESGLKTFRDSDGLWEGYDIMEVASPDGWDRNMEKVLDFYNQRRKQLLQVSPNKAHKALVKLETKYKVSIVTQNIDDLHERAGSSRVIHLHGELLKVRSTFDDDLILDWKNDLKTGDFCEHNHQLRPHVVWFGEAVPMFQKAVKLVENADILIIVGTSMQVYPAAALLDYLDNVTPIYFIDPQPNISSAKNLTIIAEKATKGLVKLAEALISS